jgi:hypothetical protein
LIDDKFRRLDKIPFFFPPGTDAVSNFSADTMGDRKAQVRCDLSGLILAVNAGGDD